MKNQIKIPLFNVLKETTAGTLPYFPRQTGKVGPPQAHLHTTKEMPSPKPGWISDRWGVDVATAVVAAAAVVLVCVWARASTHTRTRLCSQQHGPSRSVKTSQYK